MTYDPTNQYGDALYISREFCTKYDNALKVAKNILMERMKRFVPDEYWDKVEWKTEDPPAITMVSEKQPEMNWYFNSGYVSWKLNAQKKKPTTGE
jgi:hypothetical protein